MFTYVTVNRPWCGWHVGTHIYIHIYKCMHMFTIVTGASVMQVTRSYSYIYIYMYIYKCTHMFEYVGVEHRVSPWCGFHVNTFIEIDMIYVHIGVESQACPWLHDYIFKCIYIYICAYISIYICIYRYIYIYIYILE